MNVSFFYDGPLSIDEMQNYYDTALTNEVFERFYSPEKDYLNIYIRTKAIDKKETAKLTMVKKKNISITSVPNLSSISGQIFKRNETDKLIATAVLNSDAIFIRLPSVIGLKAVKFCEKYNKKYLIEMVGCPLDSYFNHSTLGKFMAPIIYLKTKKAIKDAPFVSYVTKQFLQTRYPTNGKSIACSDVSLPQISPALVKKRYESISRKEKNDFLIIGTTAAVNVRYKGQEYVIKAIAKLKEEGYNFKYYLIGGGDNTYLKKIAKKNNVENEIIFLGSVPHNQVFQKLDLFDIYVQPSKQEGLPRGVVEAMSRGCFVFGSVTGGIPELVNQKYIFKNGSVKGICNVLRSIDTGLLNEEAKRSFEEAKKYNYNLLEEKRGYFYKSYINSI